MVFTARAGLRENEPCRPTQRRRSIVHQVRSDEARVDGVGGRAATLEPAGELEGEEQIGRLRSPEGAQRTEPALRLEVVEVELDGRRRAQDQDPRSTCPELIEDEIGQQEWSGEVRREHPLEAIDGNGTMRGVDGGAVDEDVDRSVSLCERRGKMADRDQVGQVADEEARRARSRSRGRSRLSPPRLGRHRGRRYPPSGPRPPRASARARPMPADPPVTSAVRGSASRLGVIGRCPS